MRTSPSVALALTGLAGLLMRDMALTHDGLDGLMAGLLRSAERREEIGRLDQRLRRRAESPVRF